MSLKHNKKRNVGLINEFFARYMARCILEHRDNDLKKAKDLFSRHFHKGTDLHRELKLFTALFETNLSSGDLALSLIEKVKDVCKLQSQAKIDLEKTALLHEINQTLGEPSFFNQEINNYKEYATIQVLLNHWRGKVLTENLSEVVQLEDKLLVHLTHPGTQRQENKEVLNMSGDDVDGLVVNLMTEKLNKKYNSSLNQEQKKILQLYVFSKENEEARTALSSCMENLRDRTLNKIDSLVSSNKDESLKKVGSKLLEIKTMLLEDYRDTKNLDDKLVTFYMTVSKLEEELNDNR